MGESFPGKAKERHFFGVVIPKRGKEKFANVLDKAFYHNPGETKIVPYDSHTHAAILESEPAAWPETLDSFLASMETLEVAGVRHLLTQSLIQEGVFALYPIGSMTCI